VPHDAPEKSDQSPIDPAELEMHVRVEIGLIDPFPGYDAMKPPVPASTAPIQEHRTSWRETLKTIFTYAHTVD
jgi:hypothetical protein